MKPLPTSIPALMRQRNRVHKFFSKADAALARGDITEREHAHVLMDEYGTRNEWEAVELIEAQIAAIRSSAPRKSYHPATIPVVIACLFLVAASVMSVLIIGKASATGAVVVETTMPKENSTVERMTAPQYNQRGDNMINHGEAFLMNEHSLYEERKPKLVLL